LGLLLAVSGDTAVPEYFANARMPLWDTYPILRRVLLIAMLIGRPTRGTDWRTLVKNSDLNGMTQITAVKSWLIFKTCWNEETL